MKKRLEKDEIRVIKLSREAITEMLWESFMEMYHDRLDIPNDDYHVCHMTLNEDMSELTFTAAIPPAPKDRTLKRSTRSFKRKPWARQIPSIQTLSPINTQRFDSPTASAKCPQRGSPPADDGL